MSKLKTGPKLRERTTDQRYHDSKFLTIPSLKASTTKELKAQNKVLFKSNFKALKYLEDK